MGQESESMGKKKKSGRLPAAGLRERKKARKTRDHVVGFSLLRGATQSAVRGVGLVGLRGDEHVQLTCASLKCK